MPTTRVCNSPMNYEEPGSAPPSDFVQGIPTSSYFCRHVFPLIEQPGRCLAPDLIGMGQSSKPAIGYRFDDHARYLDGWFDALALEDVVLVGHDWGGALAFDYAAR